MLRLLVLLFVLGLIYASDTLIHSHCEAVTCQMANHERSASVMSYESTTPVHTLHYLEKLVIAFLFMVGLAAFVPALSKSDVLSMVWPTGLAVILLLGGLTLCCEAVTAGAEQQYQVSTSFAESEYPPMFLDVLMLCSCIGMFFIGPTQE